MRFGSTCCNPDKILAKIEAEKERATEMGWENPREGEYDKKRYKEIYEKTLKDRAIKMTTDQKPLTKKDKGGGPKMVDVILFFLLVYIVIYFFLFY